MDTKIHNLQIGDKKHHFTVANLPALIHYKCKEGGSHYSMVLIANLALSGSKALIFTGYPAAKEQFYQDTKTLVDNTAMISTLSELKKNKDKQILIIHDDDEKLCLEAIKTLEDIHERIIFIKNIDICHKQLFTAYLQYDNLILSGDLDACTAKENILQKTYASIILFSQPEIDFPYIFISGEPYSGYIRSKHLKGYVKSSG